jgi:hypothetical protein
MTNGWKKKKKKIVMTHHRDPWDQGVKEENDEEDGITRPFRGSSFGLTSEDWLREFDEIRHEMKHVSEET